MFSRERFRVGPTVGLVLAVLAAPWAAAAGEGCCPTWAFIAGKVLVAFQPGTTAARVGEIAAEVKAKVLDSSEWSYEMQVPVGEEQAYALLFAAYAEVDWAEPDWVFCIPESPPCSCCPGGLTCLTLDPCFVLFPVTLTVGKSAVVPGNLALHWSPDCLGADDYAIYEGAIGHYYSHAQRVCTDAPPALTEEIAPAAGQRYYLVVPHNGLVEGSYGRDSWRLELPVAGSACLCCQAVTDCSP